MWNAIFFPDDEDKLGEERKQLHLILGHRADGSIITIRFQGALSDALSWFGLEDLPTDIKEVLQGKVPVAKKIKEALLAGPKRLILGAKPFERTALEALTKRSLYPDVWHPRPIRDRMEHITRTFSLNDLYNRITGKPVRGLGATVGKLVTYTTEPGQAAYFEIKNKVSTFMEDHNVAPGYAEPTERSTALFYYRQAQKFKDADMAQKWLKEYIKLGGTRKTMAMAKRTSHPYAQLPLKYRSMFFKTLAPGDRERVQRAVGWWQKSF
jgi:hypothetical protein